MRFVKRYDICCIFGFINRGSYAGINIFLMEPSSILLNSILLLIVTLCISSIDSKGVHSVVDVTYEELEKLNATCSPWDSCREQRYPEGQMTKECSCNRYCAQLGTCCLDSMYKNMASPKQKPTCRTVEGHGNGYLMIDKCPFGSSLQSALEDLCNDEWNGQDDIMRIVPVTSIFTEITYKNYFCFRCHETNNEYFYWNVHLKSYEENFDINVEDEDVTVVYNKYYNTWMAQIGEGVYASSIPIELELQIPSEIASIPKMCRLDVISECSHYWSDDETRIKCSSYVTTIRIERNYSNFYYRNPHCALCNYEDLANIACGPEFVALVGAFAPKKPFSFSILIDINRSDGDKVGKIVRCNENAVWDPYFKKCRPLVCAIPGSVVKEGKCVRA